MDDPRKIIVRPVITEKSTHLIERVNPKGVPQNSYAFRVDRRATKPEIRQAIEALFNVRVKGVQTLWRRGRPRRSKRGGALLTVDWKKAIVTLQEGHKIELY